MAVTPPSSGDTITKASITSMFQTVQTIVNGMDETRFDRSALRHDQLPSIFVGGDSQIVTVTENVTTVMNADTTADIAANWQLLTNYTLDGVAAAGYTLPPCHIIAWVTMYADDMAPTQPDAYSWLGANLYYSIDSAADVHQTTNTGMFPCGSSSPLAAQVGTRLDENMTIFAYIDQTGAGGNFTLDYLRVKAAIVDVVGGGTALTQVDIPSGSIGFMALYRD